MPEITFTIQADQGNFMYTTICVCKLPDQIIVDGQTYEAIATTQDVTKTHRELLDAVKKGLDEKSLLLVGDTVSNKIYAPSNGNLPTGRGVAQLIEAKLDRDEIPSAIKRSKLYESGHEHFLITATFRTGDYDLVLHDEEQSERLWKRLQSAVNPST